jgi:hypothetical protein
MADVDKRPMEKSPSQYEGGQLVSVIKVPTRADVQAAKTGALSAAQGTVDKVFGAVGITFDQQDAQNRGTSSNPSDKAPSGLPAEVSKPPVTSVAPPERKFIEPPTPFGDFPEKSLGEPRIPESLPKPFGPPILPVDPLKHPQVI